LYRFHVFAIRSKQVRERVPEHVPANALGAKQEIWDRSEENPVPDLHSA